ncbi:MAG: 16S rRNA methyltransferase [Thermoprotei archaeon]
MAKKPLTIILLESALELVPVEIVNHPAVIKNAVRRKKKPLETLLDTSLHYHAMKNLRDREKRGRPDIVHVSLLEALESPLNKEGLLKIVVHTYPGHVIFIKPETRLPRNYNRFVGLMEQLLTTGKVPPDSDDPLMYVKTIPLEDVLNSLRVNGLIILRENAPRKKPIEIVEEALRENLAVGIGGFPHGDFSEYVLKLSSKQYSIYDKPLTTWIVVSRIITATEQYYGII